MTSVSLRKLSVGTQTQRTPSIPMWLRHELLVGGTPRNEVASELSQVLGGCMGPGGLEVALPTQGAPCPASGQQCYQPAASPSGRHEMLNPSPAGVHGSAGAGRPEDEMEGLQVKTFLPLSDLRRDAHNAHTAWPGQTHLHLNQMGRSQAER